MSAEQYDALVPKQLGFAAETLSLRFLLGE
jgi:hypothetical protein